MDVTLTGVGKISLSIGCKGYSTFALLQTSVTVKAKSMKGEDILSQIDLDFDCFKELKIKFNTSNLLTNFEFMHVASHLDHLKHASYKISDLEKEINEQEWKNHQLSKHSTYSVIVYILLSIIITYAMYKLYRYIRQRFSPIKDLKALTAP
jgi:hypothetical protein